MPNKNPKQHERKPSLEEAATSAAPVASAVASPESAEVMMETFHGTDHPSTSKTVVGTEEARPLISPEKPKSGKRSKSKTPPKDDKGKATSKTPPKDDKGKATSKTPPKDDKAASKTPPKDDKDKICAGASSSPKEKTPKKEGGGVMGSIQSIITKTKSIIARDKSPKPKETGEAKESKKKAKKAKKAKKEEPKKSDLDFLYVPKKRDPDSESIGSSTSSTGLDLDSSLSPEHMVTEDD